MKTFTYYSAQTGDTFGTAQAATEAEALEMWAKARGYVSCSAMWSMGRWEYISVRA